MSWHGWESHDDASMVGKQQTGTYGYQTKLRDQFTYLGPWFGIGTQSCMWTYGAPSWANCFLGSDTYGSTITVTTNQHS